MVSASAMPHTGVEVSLAKVPVPEGEETDTSAGLTPDTTVLTLAPGTMTGVLGFACADTVTGTSLNYVLAGTDAASFTLSATAVTVATTEAVAAVANPPMTIAVLDSSTSANTDVTGLCPALGEAWITWTPIVES